MLASRRMLARSSPVLCLRSTAAAAASSSAAPSAPSSSSKPTYTERMGKTGRPVSPHVTIYRFPIVAVSSIANRVTGVALSVGVTGIGAMALVGTDPSAVMCSIGNTFAVAPVAKFCVSFPLIYHYLGGARHIIWDKMPEQLTNENVAKSSYALFGASSVLALGLSFVQV